jgi:PhzF family phenazine biosynthesis protein
LGSAWALGPGTWEQTTAGAVVSVEVDEHRAVMTQPDPVIDPVDSTGVAPSLGLSGVDGAYLASAAGNRLLIATTTDDLAAAGPDHAALAVTSRERDLTAVCVVRRLDDRNLQVRVFVPAAGIPEDPGTGAAAGPIGVLARRELGTDVDVTIHQGEVVGRPCVIEVHAQDHDIRVGGAVTACAEGRLLV